jgi:hypothetical protein
MEELIGRGGMGEVYRAYDTRHDRVVAIKLLADHLAANDDFRRRFMREARAAARLREPHVIPIHDFDEIDGRLYLDMRLVEGSDLSAILTARGPLDPTTAVDVVSQVASALDAAHAEGLVHRDVKPSNVLLDARGFAYLVDFGIARPVAASADITTTGTPIGSLAYMAPERFASGPADHRVDVYSLACLLFQCLTGTTPFPNRDTLALIHAHANQDPPKPTAIRPDLPPAFDQVIATGMAKRPEQRFPSAAALASAARLALAHPPPTPTQPIRISADAARQAEPLVARRHHRAGRCRTGWSGGAVGAPQLGRWQAAGPEIGPIRPLHLIRPHHRVRGLHPARRTQHGVAAPDSPRLRPAQQAGLRRPLRRRRRLRDQPNQYPRDVQAFLDANLEPNTCTPPPPGAPRCEARTNRVTTSTPSTMDRSPTGPPPAGPRPRPAAAPSSGALTTPHR